MPQTFQVLGQDDITLAERLQGRKQTFSEDATGSVIGVKIPEKASLPRGSILNCGLLKWSLSGGRPGNCGSAGWGNSNYRWTLEQG